MGWIAGVIVLVILLFIVVTILSGIRIVRPTHRGLVERLGKYNRYANPGIHLTIPYGIERMYQVDLVGLVEAVEPRDDEPGRVDEPRELGEASATVWHGWRGDGQVRQVASRRRVRAGARV